MPTCLAIGPIGGARFPTDSAAHDLRRRSVLFYEEVVRPVCEQFGLTLIRADDVTGAGLLSERLIRHLVEEDIVVADLTGGSPEVVYGLGIRHATGRYTVHLGEAGTVPFGAGVFPAVEFPALPLGSAEARQKLTAAMAEGISGSAPLMLPARVLLSGTPSPTAGDGPDPAAPEEDGPGLWDLMAAAETEMEAIAGDMADVDAAILDLVAMSELIGEDLSRAGLPGNPPSAGLAALNRFARAIEGPSDDLEAAAKRFAERLDVAIVALGACLQWAGSIPRSEWPDGMDGLLDQVIEMAEGARDAAAGVQDIGPFIEMFGMTSRQLRKPVRKIGASFRTMLGKLTVFEEWEGTARELKQH